MDIKMPKLNGYEATSQIKQIKPDLNIIALTACVMPEEKQKIKEAGCDDYISKPIQYKLLLELVYKYT